MRRLKSIEGNRNTLIGQLIQDLPAWMEGIKYAFVAFN